MRCSRCGSENPIILQDFGVFEYYVKKDWNVSHAFDVHFLGFVREGLCEDCVHKLQRENLNANPPTPVFRVVAISCALALLGVIMLRIRHIQTAALMAVLLLTYVVFQLVSRRDLNKQIEYKRKVIQESEANGFRNLQVSSLAHYPEGLAYEVLVNLDGAPGTPEEKAPLPPKRERYERNFAAIRTVR